MDTQFEECAEEIGRLQRCINDLVSLLALPAIWSGGDASYIGRTALDALMGMLRLDLLYVRLSFSGGDTPVEMFRIGDLRKQVGWPEEIGELLNRWLGDASKQWPPPTKIRVGVEDMSIIPLRLGLQGEYGMIAAGSQQADFPTQIQTLLLSVAANLTTIGLREAELRNEQSRAAAELDRRVVQRTSELAAANAELRKEIAERTLVEARLRHEETALRRSEARKAAILDSALDCIVTMDHESRITEFNPAAERTFGYRRDEVMGKKLADVIIPPELRAPHRQGLARYLATNEAHVLGLRIETTAMRADGTVFPVELAITRIAFDGAPSFTGYLRDITERKWAEEELRRSETFLAEARRLSSTGGFSKRIATGEIRWSAEVYQMFGLDPAEPLTHERMVSRVHPEDVHAFNEILKQQERGVDYEHDYRLLMPDQTVKYLHVVAHAVCDVDGDLGYFGAVQDVTQRRLADEALAKARSDLAHVTRLTSVGAMTASIAHEVNQPLSGIVTNASTCLRMLAADPPNVAGARETARRTIRDANRASDVITRLRALFSRREATVETMDLNEAAYEVIALSLSELRRHRVILRQEFADDLPPVMGDRIQLQQVILNLVLNASDAMSTVEDRPRRLVISTAAEDDDHVRLMVQDTGVGFDPQSAKRLFEAFYTTKSGGMGIGLSVSRSIIESHHGRLWAVPNDGPGATFAFSIPRTSEAVIRAGVSGPVWTSGVTDTPQIPRKL
ncbi:MAG TPA: PAS domain S-box protein [Acetobacteraceae bacterium]|nr:PAS domain S-box protein [Acetobacteraceae bacterium]